jgi:transcriptional regulator with XRE-family HTH domain
MGKLGRAQEPGINRSPEQAFGFILRKIRLKRALSQQELADKSGYHRTYIGLLEGGHKSPSLRTIINIAATLKVPPSDILRRIERIIARTEKRSQRP